MFGEQHSRAASLFGKTNLSIPPADFVVLSGVKVQGFQRMRQIMRRRCSCLTEEIAGDSEGPVQMQIEPTDILDCRTLRGVGDVSKLTVRKTAQPDVYILRRRNRLGYLITKTRKHLRGTCQCGWRKADIEFERQR
ncbi:hypothetical protein ALO49_200071 [Pseudomonas savastanoi pv. retacarpa]|nr:hypothetical protein ALO49_200071 [Pseudomonas savastanoi pv. retacarpa]